MSFFFSLFWQAIQWLTECIIISWLLKTAWSTNAKKFSLRINKSLKTTYTFLSILSKFTVLFAYKISTEIYSYFTIPPFWSRIQSTLNWTNKGTLVSIEKKNFQGKPVYLHCFEICIEYLFSPWSPHWISEKTSGFYLPNVWKLNKQVALFFFLISGFSILSGDCIKCMKKGEFSMNCLPLLMAMLTHAQIESFHFLM